MLICVPQLSLQPVCYLLKYPNWFVKVLISVKTRLSIHFVMMLRVVIGRISEQVGICPVLANLLKQIFLPI